MQWFFIHNRPGSFFSIQPASLLLKVNASLVVLCFPILLGFTNQFYEANPKGIMFRGIMNMYMVASFPGFSFSYYVCWNMKNKLQKHGEREYLHACLRKRKAWCLIIADTAIN